MATMGPVTHRYVLEYLQENQERYTGGVGGITVDTYMSGALQGKAKRYQHQYVRRIKNALEQLLAEGKVETVVSAQGSTAHVPIDLEQI